MEERDNKINLKLKKKQGTNLRIRIEHIYTKKNYWLFIKETIL